MCLPVAYEVSGDGIIDGIIVGPTKKCLQFKRIESILSRSASPPSHHENKPPGADNCPRGLFFQNINP